jgi:FKBP-type peptidyl-prolyl cis-trans isomerase
MRVSILARVLRIALLPVFALSVSLAGDAMAASADIEYLNANKAKPGVQVTKTGLQYRVLREGNGKSPGPTDEVEVHYKGTLVNGRQFDSSYDRGSPARFPLNRVIPGWTEGLQLMKEGAKYEFVIPSSLGYGTMGAGSSIPANATLIFEVELLKVH